MKSFLEKINEIRLELEQQVQKTSSVKEVEALRVAFLGKKGSITFLLSELKNLSLDEKRQSGPAINQLQAHATTLLDQRKETLIKELYEAENVKKTHFDVTAYKPAAVQGHLHPYTQITEEIENIFISMGYEILDGPEVDSAEYNFDALNIPQNHPARDMYDTFWLDVPGMLLRTHTSSVQAHALREKKPPIAAIVPGRCFRHEATDASHDFMFMQCEGLLIDTHITLAHLFATVQNFLRALFKKEDLKIRIRPGYFPFVEPGVEIDMQCPFCTAGCSVCKRTRWIEVFPAGLIHPQVLSEAGIDPTRYQGFAFGFGLTRLAMIRYGINDIRLFHSGKTNFLKQF